MNLIVKILIQSLAVLIAGYILPGVEIDSFTTILVVAVVLGVINAILKPVLIILTFPITILTFGLFIFIINGILVLLVSSVIPGFAVSNIWWAILFSIVVSLVSTFLESLSK